MNVIYLHPVDGFTFLENVPEKPNITCLGKGFCCDGRRCDSLAANEAYERALAEAIEKRMVIGNPEVITEDVFPLFSNKGDLYQWPGPYTVDFVNANDYLAGAQKKVVRLVAPDKSIEYFNPDPKTPSEKIRDSYRRLKSEPVNSSIKLDPIRTGDEMQEVVNEGNSSMSEKEEKKDKIQLGALVYVLKDHDLREIFIDNNKELIEELRKVLGEPVVSQDQGPLEVLGNFLHSSGLVSHTDNADRVANDLIDYLNTEGYKISRKPID